MTCTRALGNRDITAEVLRGGIVLSAVPWNARDQLKFEEADNPVRTYVYYKNALI